MIVTAYELARAMHAADLEPGEDADEFWEALHAPGRDGWVMNAAKVITIFNERSRRRID